MHDPLEPTRHFLDTETYGAPSQVPRDEARARALLGPGLFQASGQVPWRWLAQSFGLVDGVLADDLDAQQTSIHGGQGPFGYPYWQVYLVRQGPSLKEQLTVSAQRAAQMMLLSWRMAGSPPAPQRN